MGVEWNNLNQIGRAEMTGYEAGKRDEQKRIIKLLEDYCDNNHYLQCECASQIALIKGEN